MKIAYVDDRERELAVVESHALPTKEQTVYIDKRPYVVDRIELIVERNGGRAEQRAYVVLHRS